MKDTRDKEQVYSDFAKMVKRSWTYARMTEQERNQALAVILFAKEQNLLSGTYLQRWKQLLAINRAYLDGIGYDGPFWREQKTDDLPFCVGVSA